MAAFLADLLADEGWSPDLREKLRPGFKSGSRGGPNGMVGSHRTGLQTRCLMGRKLCSESRELSSEEGPAGS